MIIENIEQSIELLKNIEDFFRNIENTEKQLKTDLTLKECERDDLLHEIELSKLNAIERMSIYSKLENVLKERRIIKDKIELINTMKNYTSKFISKGICGDTEATIQNIEKLKENQENRQYAPRILKNLKCSRFKNKVKDDE